MRAGGGGISARAVCERQRRRSGSGAGMCVCFIVIHNKVLCAPCFTVGFFVTHTQYSICKTTVFHYNS